MKVFNENYCSTVVCHLIILFRICFRTMEFVDVLSKNKATVLTAHTAGFNEQDFILTQYLDIPKIFCLDNPSVASTIERI